MDDRDDVVVPVDGGSKGSEELERSGSPVVVDVNAWRARAARAFALGSALRAQSRQVDIPYSTYRELMDAKRPSLEDLVRFHRATDFSIAEQIRVLLGVDVGEGRVGEPLWRPRITAEHLVESLKLALHKSRAVAPSVIDLGEAVVRSCRETDDTGRWRIRHFDVLGGWQFPHVAFEAVEFMRWYGADKGIDEDPWATRAAAYLGVDDPAVPEERWKRFLTPTHLAEPVPPATFEPDVDDALRAGHWHQFRLERAELNQRTETVRLASRSGWVGGYGSLHTPLLRHSASSTGRHILIQPVVRPVDVPDPQVVPVSDEQHIRTVLFLGTAAVSVHNLLGNWVADGLGWTWVSAEELTHRYSGQRPSLSEHAQHDMVPAILSEYARAPFPRTVLTVPLGWLVPHPCPRPAHPHRSGEAEHLLARPDVLPILVRPTPDTLELWAERQALAAPNAKTEGINRSLRATELYDAWQEFLADVPGSLLAEMTATLPWAGEALFPPYDAAAGHDPREAIGATEVPAFYQHPLIGDMVLRVAYELARGLRDPAGIAALRAERTPTPQRVRALAKAVRHRRTRDRDVARPLGFAEGSLIAQHETELRKVASSAHWTGDQHLQWDARFHQAPDARASTPGQLLMWTRLGEAVETPSPTADVPTGRGARVRQGD